MPLDAHNEPIATRILNCLDDAIRRPGRSHQFPSQRLDRLMMMTVHRRSLSSSQLSHDAVLQQSYAVRMAIARRALVVLNRIRMLTDNVLNQTAAARNVKSLTTETDCEDPHPALF